jgi:hypothetical protein
MRHPLIFRSSHACELTQMIKVLQSSPTQPSISIQTWPLIQELANRLRSYHTLLFFISMDTEVIICEVLTLHLLQKLLIVGDDDELEVGLALTLLDNSVKGFGERFDGVSVKIRSWLIERDNLKTVRIPDMRDGLGTLLRNWHRNTPQEPIE